MVQSFKHNLHNSFLYDTNIFIDSDNSFIDNAFEFKDDDLQENYWNIDEIEDYFIKEQLILHGYNSVIIDQQNLYESEKKVDQINFLKKKRFLNDKFEFTKKRKNFNNLMINPNFFDLENNIEMNSQNIYRNIKFDFKVILKYKLA